MTSKKCHSVSARAMVTEFEQHDLEEKQVKL